MAENRSEVRIPLVAETARLEKRVVETGRVRIQTRPVERDETINAMLARSDVTVERVPIDRVVHETPVARQDGDTWVIPVMEERLVVETQLVPREELRITTTVSHEHVHETVRLRREQVDVEHIRPGDADASTPMTQGD